MPGVLYCGDNLEVLREFVPSESVDLVYLDPPFNSRRTYNMIYDSSAGQEEAFKDSWSWEEAAPEYSRLMHAAELPKPVRAMLKSLHDLLIEESSDLLAYLTMMAPRLGECHRVLKSTGSLYLHCDPTASHYLKVILDGIFGSSAFRNEVIWQRTAAKALMTRRLPNNHDVILCYRKSEDGTWKADAVFLPYDLGNLSEKTLRKYSHVDENGRRYHLDNLTNPNRDRPNLTYEFLGVKRVWRWTRERMEQAYRDGIVVQPRPGAVPRLKRYLDEQRGVPLGDVWSDIPPVNSQAGERIGYPTQKPLALLDRILQASTSPGDLVLDPFCGCGTTVEAAEQAGRRYIGTDIAQRAVHVIEERFRKQRLTPPTVVWHPADRDAAVALAARDKLQFEAWVRRKLRATKRAKDRGIDGECNYRDASGKSWHVIISVKAGKTLKPEFVRELRGTLERERAAIGVLVTIREPSKEMQREATRAGYHHVSGEDAIPKIQLVTVDRLFGPSSPIRCPGTNVTVMPKPEVPGGQLSLEYEPTTNKKPKRKPPAKPVELKKGLHKTEPPPAAAAKKRSRK